MDVLGYLLCGLVFAFLSRLHGGWPDFGQRWMHNVLWSLPLAILSGWSLAKFGYDGWICLSSATASFLICMALKATGNGTFRDMGHMAYPEKPEKIEHLILPLHGKISEYFYDMIGNILLGVGSVLGLIIVLSFVNTILAVAMFIGGASKAIGYMVGWTLKSNQTEVGELLSGFFVGVPAWAVFLMILS